MQIHIILLFSINISYFPLRTTAIEAPEANTANGIVRGFATTGANGKDVYVFYGIPFAKPPLGELRFKRPVPISEKWETPFEATKLPNTCAQPVFQFYPGFEGEEVMIPNTEISEDCLYLNIWVPASQFRNRTNVYFWIYAGGFAFGTSTLDIYNGVNLAAEKDVIVVSSQYRVGGFGFLYTGTEDAPGNMGLVDQQLALKWVNDNIQNFGGDPAEVTLMGESAGAACVSYHLLAPRSKNLFKRALMMSGSALGAYAYKPPSEMLEITKQVALKIHCLNPNSTNSASKIVSCLRELSMEEIIEAAGNTARVPTIDGYFISDEPANLLKNLDSTQTDIMFGDTKDEGHLLTLIAFPERFDHLNPTFLSYDVFLTLMKDFFASFTEIERDAIIYYYTNWINKEDGYENQQKLGEAFGDYLFNCPHRIFADEWSARGRTTYAYLFSQRSQSSPWGKWMGVRHTDDIVYFFGQPIGNSNYTKAEQDLSRKILDLVANFARTGSPSPNWEPYTQEFPHYLDMNATIISDATSFGILGPRPDACAFWNIHLPQLRKALETQKQVLASGSSCYCQKDEELSLEKQCYGEG